MIFRGFLTIIVTYIIPKAIFRMTIDHHLRKLLLDECGVKMSDQLFEWFTGGMTEFTLQNRDVLIPYGKLDTNVYVQKSGILRACFFDGDNERTYGFSNPGTVVMSYHGHFMRRPSSFQIEACCETVMQKMTKGDFDELLKSSHEFALWMLAIQAAQLYGNELKPTIVTGSARERFLWMVKNKPQIISQVPLKTIASYLEISPEHLYRLRKTLE